MATVNIGSLKFNWKGAYNGSTAYAVDDVTEYNGSSYICILASTGNLPTNTTYFQPMATKGTDGTDVGTTLTTQGDLLYRDGSGLQRLPKGTASQQLAMNAGATAPEWVNASSDFVLLSTDNITTSTASVSRDVFSSTYKTYKVIIDGIRPVASSNAHLYYRFRRSNADLTSSDYFNHAHQSYYNNSANGDGVHNENWGADYGRIYEQEHNTGAEYGGHYEFNVYSALDSATAPHIVGLGGAYTSDGYHRHLRFSSWYQGTNKDVSGIKIYFKGQNISTGTIKIYGLK